MTYHNDFAFEPVPGLPAQLPRGESVLWRGSPQWRSLAWRGMYVRPVAIYFLILMAWRVGEGLGGGGSLIASTVYALNILPVAVAALGVLVLLAYAYARSTIYTITDRRVVIRSGVALPVTVNLPFKVIENAALRLSGDGSGDIPLKISKSQRVYSLALWPNLRPWNFSRPEPMLRCIPEAKRAAAILGKALKNSLTRGDTQVPSPVREAQLAPPCASASGAHAGEPAVAAGLQGAVS